MDGNQPVSLILAGPTGIGKTEVAVRLATRHPFELVSADSMQVYRGMAIGTAQPTPQELRGIVIHGCGIIAPDEYFSAQRFLELCATAHDQILAKGRIPLYVGGTGMYLRALRWGLFKDLAQSDDKTTGSGSKTRQRLQDAMNREGVEVMLDRLAEFDPEYAKKIGPRDKVRIIRALEVIETSGRTMTEAQEQWALIVPRFPHRLVILTCPRKTLTDRIERRVDEMLEKGWIDEVRELLASHPSTELHAFKALGYRDIAAHLRGEMSLPVLRDRIKATTRQLAKRQMTWFRKEREAIWVNYNGLDPEEAVTKIENLLAENL